MPKLDYSDSVPFTYFGRWTHGEREKEDGKMGSPWLRTRCVERERTDGY
jgi:hypothetical protein